MAEHMASMSTCAYLRALLIAHDSSFTAFERSLKRILSTWAVESLIDGDGAGFAHTLVTELIAVVPSAMKFKVTCLKAKMLAPWSIWRTACFLASMFSTCLDLAAFLVTIVNLGNFLDAEFKEDELRITDLMTCDFPCAL
jgi:hypothetical protein